jgi:hypothetical protein
MRTRWLSVLFAALAVGHAGQVHSQTADEVIEKHLAAMGGRAALEKIATRVVTGTISVTTLGGDLSGTIELYNAAPNKSRTFVKIDATQFGLGQIVQDQRFNGTSGYVIDTMGGNRELTGDQLETLRSNTFPSPLLKYKDAGSKLELLGREKAGDRDAYVLSISPAKGPSARMFIDTETYLMIKSVATINVPQAGADVEQTTQLSDYRDIDGVKVPFRIQSINQFQTVSITATKVEQNIAIDDRMFSKPD